MASAAGTTSGVLVVKTVWLANESLLKNSQRPAASKAPKIKMAKKEIIVAGSSSGDGPGVAADFFI